MNKVKNDLIEMKKEVSLPSEYQTIPKERKR